ncbi:contractile injection system protein, VgrG/Pvc8 family [Paenibacillus woosongensis]|uniref:Gp5/Type VI secretion system Vgr protein OB-fold domain-containing protein n=1 Tax=Paenibacillus woosongensis TaxID=307580 RepID=A0ABQ4MUH3_9BACL|nr:contractile injection system protein, VgrG/Pvc8 family [Paenibacillus woosongensis]GIP59577.1 hypothetical protein J15TS10_33910 [Paenibacillus woosongensis]
MDNVVTYNHIEVMPYNLIRLQDIKIVKKVNDHARLSFTGIIEEERKDHYIKASDDETQVKVFITDNAGKREPIFRGIALDVEVKIVNGIHYITVEAVSHTYQLDVKRRSRSFQNPKLTYKELIQSIVSQYDKADTMDVVTSGKEIGTFIMQYDETDWQFLKRLASHFYSPLIPAIGYGVPKFYFGMPMGLSKGEIPASNYKVTKRVADYQTASDNRIPGIQEYDFIQYEVESMKVLEPGYEVVFKGKTLLVSEAVMEMINGVLRNYYKLSPRSGLRPIKMYNHSIIGASIQGRVLSVYRDKVRVQLQMDDQQDPSSDFWFPYSTIYASEDNTGWYCMPEKNDSVRIYFPSCKEEEGYAMSSIKRQVPKSEASKSTTQSSTSSSSATVPSAAKESSNSEEDVMFDPATKTLYTKYGKKIKLAPDHIEISSQDMSIILHDRSGIHIVSSKNININAADQISLRSNKDINLTADKIELSGNGNSITLDDKTIFSGTEIKMN